MELARTIAKDLLKIKAVFFRPDEPFVWASGIKSPVYCDNRLTLSYPEVRNDVENGLAAVIRENYPQAEALMSLIGFLVDYGLFTLLTLIKVEWAHWVLICDVLARLVSASVNFTINYHLVFKKRETLWKAMLKYAGLAAFILGCNVLLLWLLHEQAGMNEYLAKIIVEITLFITSWLVQRLFVFRKRKKK